MDASCGVQKNIHKCLIALFYDVSRKLGTYHANKGYFIINKSLVA